MKKIYNDIYYVVWEKESVNEYPFKEYWNYSRFYD